MYNSAKRCLARVAFALDKNVRQSIPVSPSALLGNAYHEVVAQLNTHQLKLNSTTDLVDVIHKRFDEVTTRMYAQAHWLLRAKYPSVSRLPGYYLQRGSLVEYARTIYHKGPAVPRPVLSTPHLLVEQELHSRDKLLYGRADLISVDQEEVIDYKTGNPPAGGLPPIKEQELDQLHFYSYLAGENGIKVSRGTIIRSNGQQQSVKLSKKDALLLAEAAKATLFTYNQAVGRGQSVEQLAQPSAENCHACPFIALCTAFWQYATPEWALATGTHVQGQLTSVSQTQDERKWVTLKLHPSAGTAEITNDLVVAPVPSVWLTGGNTSLPESGSLIRVINTWLTLFGEGKGKLKVDQSTVLWTQPSIGLESSHKVGRTNPASTTAVSFSEELVSPTQA